MKNISLIKSYTEWKFKKKQSNNGIISSKGEHNLMTYEILVCQGNV